ncbi:hypothetical protein [Segatella albensis]|jgi:hypothetical protein|uniref:hypothetical protein n=1 Tax=Segatella albensis TaxID=77768 RepID=UPI00046A2940|nr:hypothetical protein [Segatella albensis]
MNYDISSLLAPNMPKLEGGTKSIKLLLSQVSEDMREPLIPMLFPILGAHIFGTEFSNILPSSSTNYRLFPGGCKETYNIAQ